MSSRYPKKNHSNHKASNKRKVVKYRKPVKINIGVIVFGIIFIYIIIGVVRYFNHDRLSIYEVTANNIADDNTCKGVIVRNETVVNAEHAGYVNYFLRDSQRVSKNSIVYTLDETRKVLEDLTAVSDTKKLSSEDSMKINNIITSFQKSYSNYKFSDCYDLKYDIDNTIYEASNYKMIKNIENIMKENGQNSSFQIKKAAQSGIISYSIDQMEGLQAEDVSVKTFENSDYKRQQLRTDQLVDAGKPIYKVVTDEKWSIIVLLTKDQYDRIMEKSNTSSIKITFPKDGLSLMAGITCYEKDNGYFAKLDISNYMIRYINERFLDVELTITSAEGLKIPVSAITEKDFYKIPIEYFTVGGDSNSVGLTKEVYDKDNNLTFLFVPVEKYYEDEEFAYIDISLSGNSSSGIFAEEWLHNAANGERFRVGLVEPLIGVYNINKGYPVFRRIEKEYENKEYCIIKDNTQYGISVYDHIILNAHLLEKK